MLKSLICVLPCIVLCQGLRWPKSIKDGMVLQATPTTAVLWGFLEENSNPATLVSECVLKGETLKKVNTYSPTQVNVNFHEIFH